VSSPTLRKNCKERCRLISIHLVLSKSVIVIICDSFMNGLFGRNWPACS
jgi:hypothetical protein